MWGGGGPAWERILELQRTSCRCVIAVLATPLQRSMTAVDEVEAPSETATVRNPEQVQDPGCKHPSVLKLGFPVWCCKSCDVDDQNHILSSRASTHCSALQRRQVCPRSTARQIDLTCKLWCNQIVQQHRTSDVTKLRKRDSKPDLTDRPSQTPPEVDTQTG